MSPNSSIVNSAKNHNQTGSSLTLPMKRITSTPLGYKRNNQVHPPPWWQFSFHWNTTITEVFMHEEIYEKIREECRIRNHSENSIKQYVYHTSCFLKWVGDKPLEELSLSDARGYILYKRNTSCSPATCNGINSALSFFYRIILKKLWIYDLIL